MSLKEELKGILERHEGRSRAIKGKELAELFGYRDDRLIRELIRELIAEGVPIASSTEPPHGYFIVQTRQEVECYAQALKARLVEDAMRRRDFRRAADQYLTPAVQEKLV